jgi:hypothetical protein
LIVRSVVIPSEVFIPALADIPDRTEFCLLLRVVDAIEARGLTEAAVFTETIELVGEVTLVFPIVPCPLVVAETCTGTEVRGVSRMIPERGLSEIDDGGTDLELGTVV